MAKTNCPAELGELLEMAEAGADRADDSGAILRTAPSSQR